MSWFQVLLFVHVAMAVAWVGGAFMLLVLAFRYSQSDDRSRMASFGQDIEWVAQRVFTPASLTAFVTGVWMVVDSDFYGFGDDWIVMGLLLYATTFLAGLLFLGPESKRIGQLAEQGSPEAPPRILRLVFLGRLDVVLLFLIIYAMTIKPEFDSQAMLVGIVGALLAGGVIWWRYRAALTQMQTAFGPPPPPPADATES
jgi:uncharacterized membrane protein